MVALFPPAPKLFGRAWRETLPLPGHHTAVYLRGAQPNRVTAKVQFASGSDTTPDLIRAATPPPHIRAPACPGLPAGAAAVIRSGRSDEWRRPLGPERQPSGNPRPGALAVHRLSGCPSLLLPSLLSPNPPPLPNLTKSDGRFRCFHASMLPCAQRSGLLEGNV